MTEVVSVKFKADGNAYYFSPENEKFSVGDTVIVETAQGLEYGTVSEQNHNVGDEDIVSPLKKVIRRATEEDTKKVTENRKKEEEAFKICEEKIEKHKLEMKLVSVSYSFDSSKIIFFFTADGRVDFRELVKDLAATFKARIELRQIGVRDQARMLGGLGICGQPYCCTRFLNGFEPVSIKMAKEQGLSLNPTKISGSCGRLMCCLKYEQNSYEYLIKHSPNVGATVETPDGKGTVTDINLITGNILVKLEESEMPIKFNKNDVKILSRSRKPVETEENEKDENEKNS